MPRLLDLFGGAGGAGEGYRRAGYEVVGVDIEAHQDAREAMGIDWMTMDDLREAIPPAYTEYLGAQILSLVPIHTISGAS